LITFGVSAKLLLIMTTEIKDQEKSHSLSAVPDQIGEMFSVGAHFARSRSYRHPSAKPFIFGQKNMIEIFDLERVLETFSQARAKMEEFGQESKTILWVSSKMEAREAILKAGQNTENPFVAGRWIGGTLTNFDQIRSRVNKLEDLEKQQEKGELARFTKKERLLIEREIDTLKRRFDGLRTLTKVPDVMFIVDIKKEANALKEAQQLDIPIVSLSGSDCNLDQIDFPIPANDSARRSIEYFVDQMAQAYNQGVKKKPTAVTEK